jgi:hypothetical protein
MCCMCIQMMLHFGPGNHRVILHVRGTGDAGIGVYYLVARTHVPYGTWASRWVLAAHSPEGVGTMGRRPPSTSATMDASACHCTPSYPEASRDDRLSKDVFILLALSSDIRCLRIT